jgi:hypothetical protein
VSDDWLQHGHEIEGAELTTVLSSSSLLRADAPPPRRFTWRAVITGAAVALLATLGVVGVANALGDNLFPSLGPASPASVWQNPVPATEPEPDDDVATTIVPTTTVPPTTVPTTGPATPTTPAPTTTVAPGAVAAAPTTSDPRRDDDDDDVAVTTLPAPSDDGGSDDDGSSSGSGSGNSGPGSSGSNDSSDDD